MKKSILLCACLVIMYLNLQSQTVTDYDGNVYNTVTIGNQIWMVENLKVTHFRNGDSIPSIIDTTIFGSIWSNLTNAALCNYNNDTSYAAIYGHLYNWFAVSDNRNMAPVGWHIATEADWYVLSNYLGGSLVAGGKLKESGTTHWLTNSGATNVSGFTGLPGGYAVPNVSPFYQMKGYFGAWWTSTEHDSTDGKYVFLSHNNNELGIICHDIKIFGYSVKCVSDSLICSDGKALHDKINIYPNPATDKFFIDCAAIDNLNLSVYNIFGQIILQKKLNRNKNYIDISILGTGLYIIEITGANGTIQKKLIKE